MKQSSNRDNSNYVVFTIEDNGSGIPFEKIDNLFKKLSDRHERETKTWRYWTRSGYMQRHCRRSWWKDLGKYKLYSRYFDQIHTTNG